MSDSGFSAQLLQRNFNMTIITTFDIGASCKYFNYNI